MQSKNDKARKRKAKITQDKLDLDLAQVQLSRPIDVPGLFIPDKVELRDSPDSNDDSKVLTWKGGPTLSDESPGQCLTAFLRLAKPETNSADVKSFAERWGVLGVKAKAHVWTDEISWEDYAALHEGDVAGEADLSQMGMMSPLMALVSRAVEIGPLRDEDEWYYEPWEVYRDYAQQAAAFLDLHAALQKGESGREEDWRVAFLPKTFFGWPESFRKPPDIDTQRYFLSVVVTCWLREANAFPILRWGGGEAVPELTLDGARRSVAPGMDNVAMMNAHLAMHGLMGLPIDTMREKSSSLFTVLALQLAAALTSASQKEDNPAKRESPLAVSARCAYCRKIFMAKRKPRAGEFPNCREQACLEEANRRRQRKHYYKGADSELSVRNKEP